MLQFIAECYAIRLCSNEIQSSDGYEKSKKAIYFPLNTCTNPIKC